MPLLLGTATTVVFWCVWYFTKAPCASHNAAMGLCNPDWLARLINVEILALASGAGVAVGGLKGGYDIYMLKNMLNQEREARLKSEQELRESEQELREFIAELRNELGEERRRAGEERQRAAEDRAQSIALQQAMLAAIVRLAEGRNGGDSQSPTQ